VCKLLISRLDRNLANDSFRVGAFCAYSQITLCAANRGETLLRRDTYQFGWVERRKRSRGPAVWVWRFRQKQSDGRDKKLSVLLGTAQEIKSEAEAWRKAEAHHIHADSNRTPQGQVSFGALCNRHIAEAAPKRHSTRKSYMTILNKHVMPRWENVRISQVRPMYVQDWLINLNLTAATKGKIKALMHRLFERAMFWELIPTERNPMGLVEIPGSSRRVKKPVILIVNQYFAILELLVEPYRTMVVVAQCLGLRVSEILALQWPDINFPELTMQVSRAVVDGIVDEVKTEYSEDDLPLDPDLATVLFNWKNQCPESEGIGFFPARSLDVAITLARFNRTISVLPVESSVSAISAGILFDTPTAPGWTQSARR